MLNRSLISTAHWALLAMLLLGVLAAPVLAAPVPAAGPADVGVAVSASDTAIAGTNLDYTITVSNDGPNAADISLADTLPAGTTFNSLDVGGGFTCTTPAVGAAGTVSCSTASLAAGDSATFTLSVQVSSSVPDGTMLSDTATVGTSATDDNANNDSSSATTTVYTNADVGITKSASADSTPPGGPITYTIDVSNAGPSDAADVAWTDALPSDVTFVSESQDSGPAFTCTTPAAGSSGTVHCSIVSLPVGVTASFTVTVLVSATPSSGVISNTATVRSSTPDYSETNNNSSTATTTVQSVADLSVTMTDTPDPVDAGGDITYTITVTNNGPGPVGDTVLTDDVPSGTEFASITHDAQCNTPEAGSGGTIECNVPPLASGGAFTYKLTVTVDATQGAGTITNTATVGSSSNADPDESNDSATSTTTVNTSADLVVANQDSPDPVLAGDQLTYSIDISNAGPTAAHDVALADTLPAGTTFVSLSAPTGFSCSTPAVGAGGTVSCTGGTIDLSGGHFEMVVKVSPSAAPGSMLSDTATVSSSTPDPHSGDESSTATTTVDTSADLDVSKTGPGTVAEGGDVSYTIDLQDNGPSDAANVSLGDTLPAGTTFKSIDAPAGWSCTTPLPGNTGTVTCTATALGAGTKATFTLVVGTSLGPGAFISNTATASSTTPDPAGGNNSSTAGSQVVASADVAVTKSDSPDPVIAGTDLTYTIGVSNNGPSSATNVTLGDTLPAGTSFVSVTAPSGFTCTTPSVGSGGTVSCTASSMSNGAGGTFTLVVHVAPDRPSGSTLSNTASVSHDEGDPNTGNDSASSTTTVATSADVSASASDSPDPVTAGTDLTYTLGLANNGPSDATDVALTDDLPSGTTFVSVDAPSGFSCTTPAVGAGGTVKCTAASLASGASRTFTLVVHVASDRPSGSTLSDTASATHGEADPNGANDSASAATTVATSADLSAGVGDSPDPVRAGDVVTYHVRLRNGGPSDASQPRLSMRIPSGMTLIGAAQTDGSAFRCARDGTAVTCGADALANGGGASIDVALRTARAQRGTVTVRPTASSSTSDPDGSNDASSESTTVTPAPTRVTIGRTVTKRRSGSIVVAIGCAGVAGDTCPVRITVTFRPPHDELAPISSGKTIRTGRRSLVYLIGSRSERRTIKRINTLPVHVSVTNRKGSGGERDATIAGTR